MTMCIKHVLDDRFCESIFPQAEKVAKSFGIKNVKGSGYRSLMDMLFCTFFPEYKASCMAYYEGTGCQLQEELTKKQIRDYDNEMVDILCCADDLSKVA